jgi:metal-responsive CopG/Arc/MetJ family transcriptional regulator
MRKTMVYLEDEQFILLKRAVSASKKRMSEIIREAISSYLKEKEKPVDYFSFVGIAEGPKKGTASERAEDVLRETLK